MNVKFYRCLCCVRSMSQKRKKVIFMVYVALAVVYLLFNSLQEVYAGTSGSTSDGCIEATSNAMALNVGDKVEVRLYCHEKPIQIFSTLIKYDQEVFEQIKSSDIFVNSYSTESGELQKWAIDYREPYDDENYFGYLSLKAGHSFIQPDNGYLASMNFVVKKAVESTTISMTGITRTDAVNTFIYGEDNDYEVMSITIQNTKFSTDTKKVALSVSSVQGKAGSVVSVPLKITENTGFNALGLVVSFDRDICSYKDIVITDDYKGKIALDSIYAVPDEKTVRASFIARNDITNTGTFANLLLQMNESSAEGSMSDVSVDIAQVTNKSELSVVGIGAKGTVTVASQGTSGEDIYMLGDVSGDGAIDLKDAVYILLAYNDEKVLTNIQKKAADVNQDGEINLVDALNIMKYFNGEMKTFNKI